MFSKERWGKQYEEFARANQAGGRIAEHLVRLRNAVIHQLTRVNVMPSDGYSNTYSDKYEIVWLARSEMRPPPKLNDHYDEDMAGHDIFETFRDARRFLVEPGVLGPLD